MYRILGTAIIAGGMFAGIARAEPVTQPTSSGVATKPAKKDLIPSEDPLIRDLHSMGLVDGKTDIFRCGSPTMDVALHMNTTQPAAQDVQAAEAQLQHLHDLGIRTIFCLEGPPAPGEHDVNAEHTAVAMEQAAAEAVGIHFVSRPMANKGKNSFEDMGDEAAFQWLDSVAGDILKAAQTGGVAFHCKAGHDRTGIVAAYIRIRYQHWSADQAIAEMRRDGHDWTKFTRDGTESWHEQHIRAIATMLKATGQH